MKDKQSRSRRGSQRQECIRCLWSADQLLEHRSRAVHRLHGHRIQRDLCCRLQCSCSRCSCDLVEREGKEEARKRERDWSERRMMMKGSEEEEREAMV